MHAVLYRPISVDAPTWAENKITDIFKIISYSYTKKFYEVGSFSMVIPVNEPSAELLEINTFLAVDDSDYLFVTGIKETESRITLEGYDLKYLLAGRITLFPTEEQDTGTYGYYVTKGSTGECICNIVKHNITEASDPNRRIFGFSVSNSAQGLAEDTYMTRLEPLDQVVATLCKNAGIGYDVTMEIGSSFGDGIRFEVIKGTDCSEKQTDVPKVIFAKSFLNVESLSREVGVDAEKNAIYAINGTNIDDAVVKLVNRDGEDKADYGVYRRETTVNVNCDVDEIDSYALKEAEDFISTDSFIIEAAAAESYKKEWFVGDIVTFRHKDITRHVPIIAAEIQRTAEKFTVKLSAGESPLKPVSGISRTANKAVDEITQKKFDDGYVLVVKELPEEGKENKIYVLEAEKSEVALLADDTEIEESEEAKVIDGYVFVKGEWKKFGGGDGLGGVGEFTNEEKNSEVFNSYKDVKDENGNITLKRNYINSMTEYAHAAGHDNSIDEEEGVTGLSEAASILSGLKNKIVSSKAAAIVCGDRNSIDSNSQNSCVAGGAENSCSSPLTFIGAGNRNKVLNSIMSIIGAGSGNSITNAMYSFIGSGESNKILNGYKSAIVAGQYNKMGGKTSVIVAGDFNEVIGGDNNFVGSGRSNKVDGMENGIVSGNANEVNGVMNAILAGGLNKIKGGNYNAIICGFENVIERSATHACIASGDGNKITSGRGSLVCGTSNECASENCIVCGTSAKATSNHAIVVGGGGMNVFYVNKNGDVYTNGNVHTNGSVHANGAVYARSFNIIGETSAQVSENSDSSEVSEQSYNLSEIILQMRDDIESLKAEIAELKGEIA